MAVPRLPRKLTPSASYLKSLLPFASSTDSHKPHPDPDLELGGGGGGGGGDPAVEPQMEEGNKLSPASAAPPPSSQPTTAAVAADNDDDKNKKKKSSLRTLTELLAPATFSTGIYYSIPPAVHENYRRYALYDPLLGFVLLGVLSTVVAVVVYYVLGKSHHGVPATEVEEGADGDELWMAERAKNKLVEIGLIYSAISFVLRFLLETSITSILPVAAIFVAGGLAGALYFCMSSPPAPS